HGPTVRGRRHLVPEGVLPRDRDRRGGRLGPRRIGGLHREGELRGGWGGLLGRTRRAATAEEAGREGGGQRPEEVTAPHGTHRVLPGNSSAFHLKTWQSPALRG